MGKVATCTGRLQDLTRNAAHCSPMVGATVSVAVAVEEALKK